ncbi:MAG TPA: retropepsin-like aspartic protease [bacterium]|nr:retropepsin-like aspartic protease [bacterium]HOL47131.1 retropepsin-like aspartic protease [bacterium]HPQ17920.1 retropepsin-like aspartic protease [bacterium]
MAIIRKKIKLVGPLGKREIEAMFDSGASYSCIRKDIAEKLEILRPLVEPMEFVTAKKEIKIKAEYAVRLDFYINGDRFSDEFIVMEELGSEIIIGAKTMQAWRMKIDFEAEEIKYDKRVTELQII